MSKSKFRDRDLTAYTTCIQCDATLLADMTAEVHVFGEDAQQAWKRLDRQTKAARRPAPGRDEDVFLIPYSIVVTVLRQITDGYVYLDSGLRFLVTLNPVDQATLRDVFRYLEGICQGVPLDEVPFRVESELADLVAQTPAKTLSLSEAILPANGASVVDPPGWAYEAVKWHVAKKLAQRPLNDYAMEPVLEEYTDAKGETKTRTVAWNRGGTPTARIYRPASDGSLLAWQSPIGLAFNRAKDPVLHDAIPEAWPAGTSTRDAEYALSHVSSKMATYPGLPLAYLNLDAHMRRINNTLVHARTALLDNGADRPLLEIKLDGPSGVRRTNRHALEILAKLDADCSILDAVEKRVDQERELLARRDENGKPVPILTLPPGAIRPTKPKSSWFSVGAGAGTHHLLMLREQMQAAFGDTATFLSLKSTGNVFNKRTFEQITSAEKTAAKKDKQYVDLVGLPPADSIRRSVEAAGYTALRILCLYYRDETRVRMLHALAHSFGIDPDSLETDTTRLQLAPGVEAVFHASQELLAHGPGGSRRDLTDKIFAQFAGDRVLMAAWCETELPHPGPEHEGLKPKQLKQVLHDSDAKPQNKRLFAVSGVPTQHIVGLTRDPITRVFKRVTLPSKPSDDHRAYMGLLDLYRSCGVLDDRFEQALYDPDDRYPLPRMAFCGVHIRKQTTDSRFKGEPQRIVCATAFIPSPTPNGPWRMLGWSNITKQWQHYTAAQAAFHAKNYPLHRADGDEEPIRWKQAGQDVREALQNLQSELGGLPYALILDGHATRRVFPGLHNNKQNSSPDDRDPRLWLPYQGLASPLRPVSIVRINCAQQEMPRLTYVSERLKGGDVKIVKTSSDLYRPETTFEGHPWFLHTVPRNYGKKRHGQHKTRWRANPGVASENKDECEENELNAPWYAMTTREITPMFTRPGFDREAIAVAVARLSHQALSWSDRTRYPAPLHAALQMDLDHPQFRQSAPKTFEFEERQILEQALGGQLPDDDDVASGVA